MVILYWSLVYTNKSVVAEEGVTGDSPKKFHPESGVRHFLAERNSGSGPQT